MEHNTGRPESENPGDFTPECKTGFRAGRDSIESRIKAAVEIYETGFRDGWNSIELRIKSAIETYEATIFVCEKCGRLAYMVDPGDGLITHID